MDIQKLPWYGQFLVFFGLCALILGTVFYFFYYSGKESDIKNFQQTREELEKQIRVAERNKERLDLLKEQRIKDEAILEQLKTVLPEKKEVDQILRRIQLLSSNNRLKFGGLLPQGLRSQAIYDEWPFKMSFEGNYHNLALFFDSLSRLTKIFNIDDLAIGALGKMSEEYSISVSFTATTYLYKEVSPQQTAKKPPASRAQPRQEAEDSTSGMGA